MVNEKRLIDANALSIEVMDASYWDNRDEDVFWNLVQDAPTVDAVEVVHGRWIDVNGRKHLGSYCSHCNKWCDYKYNYCPNCGAKMDGDGNG